MNADAKLAERSWVVAAGSSPDPCGNPVPQPHFVIQEHHARTHHFDFRLEKDGVFKSWAVPKGLPEEPGTKRLAIQVEDHDLLFGAFEGRIPDGQYGAGEIRVWDRGIYESAEWSTDRITFSLSGARVTGHFELFRLKHGKPGSWLLLKRSHPVRNEA